MSWHAPNRAGEGLKIKMAGYTAIIEAVRNTDGPLIVEWMRTTDLRNIASTL